MAIPGEAPTIEFHPTRSWGFPEGTVLVKSFAVETIEGDAASREWIETRLFTRQQGEWVGYSYAWNEAQTDATLVETQGAERNYTVHTTAGVERRNWRFPSRAECLVCHSRAANFVLGVTTAQLNKLHDYGEVKANQLSTLEAIGLLRHDPRADFATHYKSLLTATGKNAEEADAELKQVRATRDQRAEAGSSRLLAKPPSAYDQLADPYNAEAPLESRARSYLHVNCASCHVEAGGGNAQIDLAYTRDRDAMRVLGLPPLHQNFGLPRPAIVAAGAPERSVLLHRTALRGPGQMPPLATSVVDQRAVAMLREWIASLEATPSNESSP